MAKVTTAEAKLHLRVDHTEDDALITNLIAVAYQTIEGRIFRKMYADSASIPTDDLTGIATNEAINAAALLIVGHLYANREDVAAGNMAALPMGSDYLLTPYVNFAGGA